jgi:hypothetical protein
MPRRLFSLNLDFLIYRIYLMAEVGCRFIVVGNTNYSTGTTSAGLDSVVRGY